jgi:hypothetical protein
MKSYHSHIPNRSYFGSGYSRGKTRGVTRRIYGATSIHRPISRASTSPSPSTSSRRTYTGTTPTGPLRILTSRYSICMLARLWSVRHTLRPSCPLTPDVQSARVVPLWQLSNAHLFSALLTCEDMCSALNATLFTPLPKPPLPRSIISTLFSDLCRQRTRWCSMP